MNGTKVHARMCSALPGAWGALPAACWATGVVVDGQARVYYLMHIVLVAPSSSSMRRAKVASLWRGLTECLRVKHTLLLVAPSSSSDSMQRMKVASSWKGSNGAPNLASTVTPGGRLYAAARKALKPASKSIAGQGSKPPAWRVNSAWPWRARGSPGQV